MGAGIFLFKRIAVLIGAFICLVAVRTFAADAQIDLEMKHIDSIAAMLPEGVFAFGPRINDRDAWQKLGDRPEIHAMIAKAVELISAAGNDRPRLPGD